MPNPTCTVPECQKPARSSKAALCPMHYHRQYRHGDVNKTAREAGISVSGGRKYVLLYLPSHPIVGAAGRIYAHRAVLYDAIGPGPHPCHWCSCPVDWLPEGSDGELEVDHLNGIGNDNRIGNLVPACRSCNTTRGGQHRADALRAAGWWSGKDTIAGLRHGRGRKPKIEDGHAPAA